MRPAWMQEAAAAAPAQAPVVPPVVPGRVLQFDGDLLAYWAGGNEGTSVSESRQRATTRILAMQAQAGADSVIMHLTAPSSTKGDRFLIAAVKPYQGQRNSGRRPQNWAYLREWLTNYAGPLFTPKVWARREADDGIALMAWHAVRNDRAPVAIASGDKDMRMIPGVHVDWNDYSVTVLRPGEYDVIGENGLQYGTKWFWLQMLQGDTADNIPGLPKYMAPSGAMKPVGEKTAQALLAETRDDEGAYQIVLAQYANYYGSILAAKEAIAEQAMLLWMRTDFAADVGDFRRVCTAFQDDPVYSAIIETTRNRIKEKYAEAQALGAAQLPPADAG